MLDTLCKRLWNNADAFLHKRDGQNIQGTIQHIISKYAEILEQFIWTNIIEWGFRLMQNKTK